MRERNTTKKINHLLVGEQFYWPTEDVVLTVRYFEFPKHWGNQPRPITVVCDEGTLHAVQGDLVEVVK